MQVFHFRQKLLKINFEASFKNIQNNANTKEQTQRVNRHDSVHCAPRDLVSSNQIDVRVLCAQQQLLHLRSGHLQRHLHQTAGETRTVQFVMNLIINF